MRTFLQTILLSAACAVLIVVTGYGQPIPVTQIPSASNFTPVGGLVYFNTPGGVYRTDGTSEGTFQLTPITGRGFREFRGEVYFLTNAAHGAEELWKSDGTPEGTMPLTALFDILFLGQTDEFLFFAASMDERGRELYRTNGEAEGTILLKDIRPGPQSGLPDRNRYASWLQPPDEYPATVLGNEIFFGADDGENGNELWKSDGTPSGTVLVNDIHPGSADGFGPGPLTTYDGRVYFSGIDPLAGRELWISDGSESGTAIFEDLIPGTDGNMLLEFAPQFDGKLLFGSYVDDGNGTYFDLWKTEGSSASTEKLGTLCRECRFDSLSHNYNGTLHFFMYQEYGTHLLWQTNGTAEGTEMIYSEFLDGGIPFFEEVNDLMIFYTTTQGHNMRMYRSDGTSATPFRTFASGGNMGSLISIAKVGDLVYFADHAGPADNQGNPDNPDDAYQLLQTDGVTVQALRDIFGVSFTNTSNITDYNDRVLFTTREDSGLLTLWLYDPSDISSPDDCVASGHILREFWDGIPRNDVDRIPLDTEPASTSLLTSFEGPQDDGINYGARVRGYLCPPASGYYTFWIASNDFSELWLSTDDRRVNRVLIAYVNQSGAVAPRQWNKHASQQSDPVYLVAGKKYYVEALHKQGVGSAHLAVGWRLPDGTLERPIPGDYLSPYAGEAPTVTITSPESGASFDAPGPVVIQATATDEDDDITLVEFFYGEEKIGEDATAPYEVSWTIETPGEYVLTATATDARGETGTSESVTVTITAPAECVASGTILREYWGNVPYAQVSYIPTDTPPHSMTELSSFEGPIDDGVNYGARVRGFICVPATGDYTFWIASNDHSELWLSTDDQVENRQLIAYVNGSGATAPRQWNKFASQRSVPIHLEAGKQYYIEALHKQGIGSAHLAVGWQLPDGTLERPIPGNRLSPFSPAEQPDETMMSMPQNVFSQITVYPNPVTSDASEVTIAGYEGIQMPVDTEVRIMNMAGDVVFAERISCGGDCSSALLSIHQPLVPGVYIVSLQTNGNRYLKRLIVR